MKAAERRLVDRRSCGLVDDRLVAPDRKYTCDRRCGLELRSLDLVRACDVKRHTYTMKHLSKRIKPNLVMRFCFRQGDGISPNPEHVL